MRANVDQRRLDASWTRFADAATCPVCGAFGQRRTHIEQALACVEEPSEWRLANGGRWPRIELAPATLSARLARLAVEQRLTESLPSEVSSGAVS
jgi:hypothetical protein